MPDHDTPYLWDLIPASSSHEKLEPKQLAGIYFEAYRRILGRVPRSVRDIQVSFFPYCEVQANVRWREGVLRVRISEVLRDMPARLHRALAVVLVGKMERKAYPRSEEERFDRYAKSELIQRRMAEQVHRRPSRAGHYGTAGEKFNLNEIFDRVNREYFGGEFPRPSLSWTRNRSRRRMGYVDEERKRVYISKTMDRRAVPRYAIEFIMYHELLHLIYPSENRGKRVLHHTRDFRRAERMFKHYEKARRWMGFRD